MQASLLCSPGLRISQPQVASRGRQGVCRASKKGGTVRVFDHRAPRALLLGERAASCTSQVPRIFPAERARHGGKVHWVVELVSYLPVCLTVAHDAPAAQVKGGRASRGANFISVPSLESDGWRLKEAADIISRFVNAPQLHTPRAKSHPEPLTSSSVLPR